MSCSKDDNDNNTSVDFNGCTNELPFLKDGELFVYKNKPIVFPADTFYQSYIQTSKNQFKITNKFDEGIFISPYDTYMGVCGKKVYSATKSDFSDAFLLYD